MRVFFPRTECFLCESSVLIALLCVCVEVDRKEQREKFLGMSVRMAGSYTEIKQSTDLLFQITTILSIL